MDQHWTGQLFTEANPALDNAGGDGFCPECGQPLDLSRHVGVPATKWSLEAYGFAIFGLVLIVFFGVNALYARRALVDIDHQMKSSRASIGEGSFESVTAQERVVARILSSLLIERHSVQTRFDRDIAGIALGVVTTVLGVGTLIRQRRERLGSTDQSHRALLAKVTFHLCDLGQSVIRPLLWTMALLCVGLAMRDVIQGAPLTLDLLNRALERTVEIIVTMSSTLS